VLSSPHSICYTRAMDRQRTATHNLALRLLTDLYQATRAKAAEEGRSINAQIVWYLRRALEAEGAGPAPYRAERGREERHLKWLRDAETEWTDKEKATAALAASGE
jgi:hypothetical protein